MQIPPTLLLNQRPPNRRPRQCRNRDPKEHKRNPRPPLSLLLRREIPNSRIIQTLHRARAETVEASNHRDSFLGFSWDPGEEEEGG